MIGSVSLAERFYAKVDTNGPIPMHNPELGPCHLWTAGRAKKGGYGRFTVNGKDVYAHRVGWELENGPMPPDKISCHKCDNPPCVRGSHVYPGTHADNARDKMMRGRYRRVDRHGECNGRAKLTRNQVDEMRVVYERGGVTQRVLAGIYGIPPGTIGCILARSRWL